MVDIAPVPVDEAPASEPSVPRPDDVPADHDGGLLIRVWREADDPDRVRARVLSFTGTDEPRTWTTAADETAVLELLERWVRDRLRRDRGTTT